MTFAKHESSRRQEQIPNICVDATDHVWVWLGNELYHLLGGVEEIQNAKSPFMRRTRRWAQFCHEAFVRLSTGQCQCHAAGGCLIACGVYDWQSFNILRLPFISFISRNGTFVHPPPLQTIERSILQESLEGSLFWCYFRRVSRVWFVQITLEYVCFNFVQTVPRSR